jgi:hypothetical protein
VRRMRQLTGELSKLQRGSNCHALRSMGTTSWAT